MAPMPNFIAFIARRDCEARFRTSTRSRAGGTTDGRRCVSAYAQVPDEMVRFVVEPDLALVQFVPMLVVIS